MNMLIVDDEISSINAVQKGIHWDELPITSVYTANSMQEAIEQLGKQDIDIMLSDIEMPMGTGHELLQWVKDNKEDIVCIFMTCHADFSFAQNAIQLGCFDYLLKPLNYSVVETTIMKAVNKIRNERILKINSSAWLKNKSIVLKQFWKDFFVGDILPDKKSLSHYIQSKKIDVDIEKSYIPQLICIKNNLNNFTEEEQRLMEFSIRNISEEIFVIENVEKQIIAFNDNNILIMFAFDPGLDGVENNVKACCEKLVKVIQQFFDLIICCYIGKTGSIYTIPSQIESLQVNDFQNVAYHQKVVSLPTLKQNNLAYKSDYNYNNSIFKSWNELTKENSFQKLFSEIRKFLMVEDKFIKINRVGLQDFYQDYYHILIAFTVKHNLFLSELFGDEQSQRYFQNAILSVDNLLQWIEYTIKTMEDYIDRNEEVTDPVEKTIKYINHHISDEISMNDIAENVHLNADYLTRIFKKECGVSINRYIINLKMEIAKKLLVETDKPIGEISMAVGYFNYSSFNKIFTKNEMMSPQEYKRLYKK